MRRSSNSYAYLIDRNRGSSSIWGFIMAPPIAGAARCEGRCQTRARAREGQPHCISGRRVLLSKGPLQGECREDPTERRASLPAAPRPWMSAEAQEEHAAENSPGGYRTGRRGGGGPGLQGGTAAHRARTAPTQPVHDLTVLAGSGGTCSRLLRAHLRQTDGTARKQGLRCS